MNGDTTYIDTDEALAELCTALGTVKTLAVDTEFIRERTYFPSICLVQLAAGGRIALVDPLAIGDLEPLHLLLSNTSITKLMHAARQDLEIFFHDTAGVPAPLFDTQIAASLAGFTDQIGYAGIVHEMLGVDLDKSQTRTDWRKRPLSEKQLVYAADDVRYLHAVHDGLTSSLEASGRLAWAHEDSAALCDPSLYAVEPDSAWQRIKAARHLSGAPRRAIRSLAAWREELAVSRDLPRQWLIRDDMLTAIARADPFDTNQLGAIDGLPARFVERHGDNIMAVLEASRTIPPGDDESPARKAPDAVEKARVKRLQALIDNVAETTGVSAAVLAPRRDLRRAARGRRDLPMFRGWRRSVVGAAIEQELADRD